MTLTTALIILLGLPLVMSIQSKLSGDEALKDYTWAGVIILPIAFTIITIFVGIWIVSLIAVLKVIIQFI